MHSGVTPEHMDYYWLILREPQRVPEIKPVSHMQGILRGVGRLNQPSDTKDLLVSVLRDHDPMGCFRLKLRWSHTRRVPCLLYHPTLWPQDKCLDSSTASLASSK